jgi:hypothetical protein
MTNALAIAGVTATLRDLLDNGLVDASIDALGSLEVTCQPPDKLVQETERNRLNIYPWKILHNPAFANERLPARDASGTRLTNPRLGLDLHFILTATGESDLNACILLGYGMQILHEHPLLTSADIRAALQIGVPPVQGSILPAAFQLLVASDLADQVERVRIRPAKTEEEDLVKIWPAFNAALRMSSLYIVSVVMIEAARSLSEGPPVRDYQVLVNTLKRPTLARVVAQPGPLGAAVNVLLQPVAGSRVMVTGAGLVADHMALTVGGLPVVLTGAGVEVTAQRMSVVLPGTLPAGMHLMQMQHFWQAGVGDLRPSETSNALAMIVAPTVTVTHAVALGQVARVHLAPLDPAMARRAFTADVRVGPVTVLVFTLTGVAVGDYTWVLDVDGGESLPVAITFGGP